MKTMNRIFLIQFYLKKMYNKCKLHSSIFNYYNNCILLCLNS